MSSFQGHQVIKKIMRVQQNFWKFYHTINARADWPLNLFRGTTFIDFRLDFKLQIVKPLRTHTRLVRIFPLVGAWFYLNLIFFVVLITQQKNKWDICFLCQYSHCSSLVRPRRERKASKKKNALFVCFPWIRIKRCSYQDAITGSMLHAFCAPWHSERDVLFAERPQR